MNKQELIEKMSSKSGLTKTQAEKALNAIEESIINALSSGDKVTLVGFGTFSILHRKERKGRNPQTGQEMTIPAKKTPKFAPAKVLKEVVK
jgi:DNA-binding protein HU-beta